MSGQKEAEMRMAREEDFRGACASRSQSINGISFADAQTSSSGNNYRFETVIKSHVTPEESQ
jgi:hypothetical protein